MKILCAISLKGHSGVGLGKSLLQSENCCASKVMTIAYGVVVEEVEVVAMTVAAMTSVVEAMIVEVVEAMIVEVVEAMIVEVVAMTVE